MGNFLGLKLIEVIGLDGRFPRPQALSCQPPQRAISSASSPQLSLTLRGDFLGLKLGAVIGLDGRFFGLKPLAVLGLDRQVTWP
jgi:hypothetical protein